MTKEKAEGKVKDADKVAAINPRVKWNDSTMKTHYTNAFNVFSSREEVTLLFGTNQTLYNGQEEVNVDLSNRLILSPHRAKALSVMLNNVLSQYEKIYGSLGLEAQQGTANDA